MPYDESIEIETIEKPGVDYFKKNYLYKNKPVKIVGAMQKWPCMKLFSLDFFEQRYGDEVVGVEKFDPDKRGFGKNSPQDYCHHLRYEDMVLKDLISVIKNKPDHMYYMAQHPFQKSFSGLRTFLPPNPYTSRCVHHIPGAHMDTYLWIGPKGTLTPIHTDPMPNFLSQVVGRKKAILFPPNQSLSNLYIGKFERESFSPVDIEDPDLEKFPRFRDSTPYETIIEPGEMLHIPINWGHTITSLDTSISLSEFFITYPQLFTLFPSFIASLFQRAISTWRWEEQKNERASVNPPPKTQNG